MKFLCQGISGIDTQTTDHQYCLPAHASGTNWSLLNRNLDEHLHTPPISARFPQDWRRDSDGSLLHIPGYHAQVFAISSTKNVHFVIPYNLRKTKPVAQVVYVW